MKYCRLEACALRGGLIKSEPSVIILEYVFVSKFLPRLNPSGSPMKMKTLFAAFLTLQAASLALCSTGFGKNPNLAFQADVSATSEYSADYSAAKAVDGIVAEPKTGDAGTAWCVSGETAKGQAEFTLTWEKPVTVSQIVCFGRSGSSFIDESFRDYEVYFGRETVPAAKGALQPVAEAQKIDLPTTETQQIRIRFLSDFHRPNPGMAEILVFASPAAEADIREAFQGSEDIFESCREAGMPDEIVFCTRKHCFDGHWYANIGYYADNVCHLPWPMNSGGGLYAYNVRTKALRTILEDPAGNFRDPQVHYDGHTLLFSYLPAGKKHFSLYEIQSDGTGLRQITGQGEDEALKIPEGVQSDTSPDWRMSAERLGNRRDFSPPGWDDYEAAYLPDGKIVFCSTRAKRYVGCWLTQVGTVYRCDSDGKNILPLSSNVEQDNTPWVLPSGKIIYMRWEYVDRSQVNYHHLWTMNPDGTQQTVFYGNLHPGTTMLGPKPIPGTRKIVCTFSPGHGIAEHYGYVTVVDPSKGPDTPQSAQRISRSANHSDPWAFDASHFMVASGDKILLLNARGQEQTLFQLPENLAKEGFLVNEPRPLAPHAREEVLTDQTDYTKDYGVLAMANLYKGRKMRDLQPGTVTELLVYETLPKPIHYTGGTEMMSIFGTFTLERLLGRVPVGPDGSAYFKLPANRPVLFVAMDEKGHCVKRMHSFTSVMPGESAICIGCHEERTQTPDSDDRNRLMKRMRTRPDEIQPIDGLAKLGPDFHGVFDFPRNIQPILDEYCVKCHNSRREDGGVNLSGHWSPLYTISYANLTWLRLFGDNRNRAESNFDPYKIGTGSSELVRLIEQKHQGVEMSEEDQKIIRLWIDAGANFAGTYAAEASGGVGYYMANIHVHNEKDWPETLAMRSAVSNRCDVCHAPTEAEKKIGNYDLYSDNYSNSNPRQKKNRFIAHDLGQTNGRYSRLEIFDLSYPEQSKILLAPLSKAGGGLGICEQKSGQSVFNTTDDPEYQAILAGIQRGRDYILQEDNRYSMLFDSPNNGPNCPQRFVPRWAYLREMIRYGILPPETDPEKSVNPFELDEKYWKSLWFRKN